MAGTAPTHAGFWWYRVGPNWSNAGDLWCVRVTVGDEGGGYRNDKLYGWVPALDYMEPITPAWNGGEWLGEALPPDGQKMNNESKG